MNKETVYGFIEELLRKTLTLSVYQSEEVDEFEFYFSITGFIGESYFSTTLLATSSSTSCNISQVSDDIPEFLSIVGEFENKIDFKIG
jgi:ATP-dependent helicase/DNAse subunit B